MLNDISKKTNSTWQMILDEVFGEFDTMFGIEKFDYSSLVTTPPDPSMGDLSLPCFVFAKELGKNPAAIASKWAAQIAGWKVSPLVEKAQAAGPYLNVFLNSQKLAERIMPLLTLGVLNIGKGKKYIVEFGCPNPLKAFHLGHLKNLITGESVARILENAGYKVVRTNYQGDVGMHIAKAMWAIQNQKSEIRNQKSEPLEKRLELLGQMYAKGAKAFEESEEAKKEIVAMNKMVYEKDAEIQEVYRLAVDWSLEYFDNVYKRLGARFDRLYMESEVFGPGERIVRENIEKGIFKKSQGAVIYEGSKHGLHDRVFINSEGFPTYEAKDVGLAEAHFRDHNPDKVVHVVGKEQVEYFKVVFKAIGEIWPGRDEKEFHLPGGFLQLKEGKMSSRTGNVVLGEALLAAAKAAVTDIMKDRELPNKEEVIEKVTVAAVKYSILKVQVSADVAFDLKTSVSLEGDSGPYLLYIVARIGSIIRKSQISNNPPEADPDHRRGKFQTNSKQIPNAIEPGEKQLLLKLAMYPEATAHAAQDLDPSKIVQYLFDLAQTFNTFYHACPVLQAEDESVRAFRLWLVQSVRDTMTRGLSLLGIETVAEM